MTTDPLGPRPKQHRGFAAMSTASQLAAARKGGASVPRDKRSFSKDSTLAAEAGRKGGMAKRKGTV